MADNCTYYSNSVLTLRYKQAPSSLFALRCHSHCRLYVFLIIALRHYFLYTLIFKNLCQAGETSLLRTPVSPKSVSLGGPMSRAIIRQRAARITIINFIRVFPMILSFLRMSELNPIRIILIAV